VSTRSIETDYLVVGCGAAGMAFADSLIDASRADVVMVDRRHAPGGHWLEAYPFVRLHQPSAYYGVNSLPLGSETIDRHGPNAGMYERAGAAEICGYYDRVMQQRLLPSGQVRYFPMSSYVGEHRFVSDLSRDEYEVKVRKKLVDATYLEGRVPASSPPPFEVAPEARCIPVGALADVRARPEGYVVIGAGKTALDACIWLLDGGVSPEDIRWIKPREGWFINRHYVQGGDLVGTMFEGLSLQLEAAARATSIADLFGRLEASRQLLRVDPHVEPTMFRGPTLSSGEVDQLRRIEGVVRLGKVRCVEPDRIVLDGGTIPTSPRNLHVHCAAEGLSPASETAIFSAGRITLQSIRIGLLPFASALIAFVEATRDDLDAKNRLCPPNRQPNVPLDWLRGMLVGMKAARLWSKEPDIANWIERGRLNMLRGLPQRNGEPSVQEASARFTANVSPGLENLERLCATTSGAR
jgi:NAD(P)-binding Rossmann-like domain